MTAEISDRFRTKDEKFARCKWPSHTERPLGLMLILVMLQSLLIGPQQLLTLLFCSSMLYICKYAARLMFGKTTDSVLASGGIPSDAFWIPPSPKSSNVFSLFWNAECP
jgi:hypothetical protein